jgi:hypothetical protein
MQAGIGMSLDLFPYLGLANNASPRQTTHTNEIGQGLGLGL